MEDPRIYKSDEELNVIFRRGHDIAAARRQQDAPQRSVDVSPRREEHLEMGEVTRRDGWGDSHVCGYPWRL